MLNSSVFNAFLMLVFYIVFVISTCILLLVFLFCINPSVNIVTGPRYFLMFLILFAPRDNAGAVPSPSTCDDLLAFLSTRFWLLGSSYVLSYLRAVCVCLPERIVCGSLSPKIITLPLWLSLPKLA